MLNSSFRVSEKNAWNDKTHAEHFDFLSAEPNFIIKKYSEYIGKRRFIYMLSIFYRRIKYISILPCKDFSMRCLRSPRSKYYKDVSSIINSCKAN